MNCSGGLKPPLCVMAALREPLHGFSMRIVEKIFWCLCACHRESIPIVCQSMNQTCAYLRQAVVILVLAVTCHLPAAAQTILANIQSVDAPTGTATAPLYVIDADASNAGVGYDRDAFTVSVPVIFTKNTADFSNTETFRVSVQLYDSNNNVVGLQGGVTSTASLQQDVSVNIFTPNTSRTFVVRVDPGVDLGASNSYHVRATVQRLGSIILGGFPTPIWFNADGPDSSSSFVVMHFTNTLNGDAALNVRGQTTGAPTWSRSYAVIPDLGFDNTFRVTVPYFLARYDLGAATTTVSLRLTATLTDDLGNNVPLKNSGAYSNSLSMAAMLTGSGLPDRPREYTGNATCLFEPVAQLNSSGRTYRVRVQLEHVETPAFTYRNDGTSADTALTRLLHFNGNLAFGPLATNFEWLTFAPTPGSLGAGFINTTITVGSNAGTIPSFLNYGYGNNLTSLSVRLQSNGDCVVTAGAQPLVVSGGGTVSATYGGIAVKYPSVTLQSTGPIASSAQVQLPQGLGYNPDRTAQSMRYEPVFSFGASLQLNTVFRHTGTLFEAIATPAWVFDESRPMIYRASACQMTTAGVISFESDTNEWVHTAAVTELETQQGLGQHEIPDMAYRLNNDGYLRFVETPSLRPIEFTAAADGTARTFKTEHQTKPGEYFTHMPHKTLFKWNGFGVYKINSGAVSGHLQDMTNFEVVYDAACTNATCGPMGGVVDSLQSTSIVSDQMVFSPDGGLHAAGEINPKNLEWGFKGDGGGGSGPPSHQTDVFVNFTFYAPGNQLYEVANPLGGSDELRGTLGPACINLSGYDPAFSSNIIYPKKTDYVNGEGSYAGMNFVQASEEPNVGGSSIADMPSISPYTLQEKVSKYYVRQSGVSGRQVAVEGTFDPNAMLYGYGFTFTRFQLTFLSDENEDSWINGSVAVPYPSDFVQQFEELTLTCTGALDSALIDPDDTGEKNLSYWNGKFTPLSMRFNAETGAGCYDPRFLTIGLTSGAANIETPLSGSLAFMPDGNIAPLSANIEGVDGRLGLPATVLMDGPGDERYHLVPVSKLYFNAYNASGRPDDGYVGFGASCDVPFFEDLKLHVMTSARASVPANIYLTGGWTESGDTFFSNRNFDPNHHAFPPMGISVEDYRNPQVENAYVPRAQQSIFGLVDLDYPMQWDTSGRYFTTWGGDREVDLFVVDVQHQVEYLSAENAEITFGVQYEGIPQINLASAVFDQAEEQIGAVRALVDSASEEVTATLYRGVEEIGNLVSDNIELLLDEALDGMEDDVLCPLYDQLETLLTSLETGTTNYNDFVDRGAGDLKSLLDSKFNTAGAGVATIQNRINELANTVGEASSVLTRIDRSLEDGVMAINSVIGEITQQRNELGELENIVGTFNGVSNRRLGILARDSNGDRDIVNRLLDELMRELAPEGLADELFAGLAEGLSEEINAQLGSLLEEADPALDRIVEVLGEARTFLVDVRTQLANGIEMVEEFEAILNGATMEVTQIINDVRESTFDFIDEVAYAARIDDEPLNAARSLLDEFSKEEFVAHIKAEIRDQLLNALFVQQIQATLRGYISDLEVAMNSAIDSVFSEITNLCREVIDEFLGPIDDAINGLAGDINEYVGAGSLDGYAHIEGDTLRRLRIDAEVSLKVPDEMALKGFFEYNCYDSTTDGAACVDPGTSTVEIKVGAIDAPLDWVNPGVKADLTVWFTMALRASPGPGEAAIYPKGIGGSLEMTEGEINFESLRITRFGAAVAVGIDDCYLAATATVIVSGYEATGGIFFGRSCSLEPLEMVDPDVAGLIGPAPFIGAYVYGEVWIPISEVVLGIPASCLFQISAGVGAGAFYFVSGPDNISTFGGKMLLGVSGEALCIVSIRGEVNLIGVMSGSSLRFTGKGTLTGKAGPCPFCVKFKESVKVTYQDGDFTLD